MPDRRSELCDFVFDPKEWEAETVSKSSLPKDDVLDDDGLWRCPHAAHDDSELCLFHLPSEQTDDVEVRDRFLEQIEEQGREPKQFLGATFGRFDLAYAVVESADNNPIDLRYARFTDTVCLEYTVVRQPLNLEETTFHATADFLETRFLNEVYLSGSTFEQDARFYQARFTDGGIFYHATFAEANFHQSVFSGHVDFIQAQFEQCHFREAVFRERVHFDKAQFEHASFPGARFDDDTYFDGASFPERANFRQTDFSAICSFTDLSSLGEDCCIDLQNSTVSRGRLTPASTGVVVYDLWNATVGEVSITEDTAPSNLFHNFRILNTTFEGFDFGAYREALGATDWELHKVTDVSGLQPGADIQPSPGECESTYLKAKNGANAIGDTKAAAEFFRKEMGYRRHQYVARVRDSELGWRRRVVAGWRWAANGILDTSSAYGERPSRVVATSVAIVLLFTGLFSIVTPELPYGSPIGNVVLSLESFVTLVLGGAEPIRDPWIRLLAQVEGFIGAFLIALFVFTLTRSIHR